MNDRRAGTGLTRPLAALLALSFPLTALGALAGQTAAATPAAAVNTADPDDPAPQAASEVRAFDLAKTSGKRVEIIDRRTEYSETYANPDGKLTLRQSTLPIWTRHNSVWRRTDTTLTTHEDGTLGPTASFGIAFSQGGDGPMVAMDRDGKNLALTWPGTLPEPVVEGNTALYKSVLPDVDLQLIADVNGFAQHLIVNTPEAAANPALKTITLGVSAEGVTLDDDTGDQLLAKAADGTVIFSAPKPKMWEQPDSDTPPAPAAKTAASPASFSSAALAPEADPETLQQAPVGADVTGKTLTLTPDPALLAAADQFPLVIDPTFTGGRREKWAVVYSAYPDADYPNGSGWQSENPADEPRIGYNGSGTTRSFFAMNISGLEGATVSNVAFAVEQTHSWGCDASAAGPTELRTSRDIATTPTWRNSGSYLVSKLDQGHFAHGNPTFCPGVEGYDFSSAALTSYVQDGANHGWSQLTFGLKAAAAYEGNKNSFKRIRNNPVLELDYDYRPRSSAAEPSKASGPPGPADSSPYPAAASSAAAASRSPRPCATRTAGTSPPNSSSPQPTEPPSRSRTPPPSPPAAQPPRPCSPATSTTAPTTGQSAPRTAKARQAPTPTRAPSPSTRSDQAASSP